MKKAILFFLIPLVIFTIGIAAVKLDHKPEVVHVAKAYGPGTGYELQPEQWTVTASPHYKWTHGTGGTGRIVFGILLLAIGGAYVWYVNEQVKTFKLYILIAAWVLAGFVTFGKHAFKYYESNKYSRTISNEQYQLNKDDLDKIFDQ